MDAQLTLSGAYFLSLHVAGGAGAPDIRAGGQRLAVIRDQAGATGGWLVPVPGWLWQMVAPGAGELVLACDVGGGRQDFTIPRARVLARLEEIATQPAPESDHARVAALEHAHYAALFDALSPGAREYLARLAGQTGLGDVLPVDLASATDATDAAAGAGSATGATSLSPKALALLVSLGRAVRAVGPGSAPGFLRDMLEEFSLDPDDRAALTLELMPHFCAIDRVEALHDILLPKGAGSLPPDWDRPWRLSRLLPSLLLSQRFRMLRDVLARLAKQPDVWASTAPIAWTLRRLTGPRAPFLPADLFEGILGAALDWIAAQAGRPEAPLRCAELRGAMVDLLDRRWLCSDALQGRIMRVLLRGHGFDPAFWEAVRALPGGVPDAMRAADLAFAELHRGAGGAGAEAALDLLRRLGVADAAAARLDILGPGGVAHGDMPLPVARLLGSADGGRGALLRAAAAPGSPGLQDGAGELAEAIRAAMPGPKSPHGRLRRRAMADGFALLAAARRDPGAALAPQVAALLPGLVRLAGQGTGFVGLWLALALVRDLQAAGAGAAATRLADGIAPTLRQVVGNAGAAMAGAPGLASVAARLVGQSGPAGDLLALLPAELASEPAPELAAPWAATPALFDTLVVVCSCQAHMQSRIPALRSGWLGDLDRFGIPYVILTGGDETRLDGDVLQVAAPDSYEGLPQKILAMVDWVAGQTGFAHLLKIDDDCHLDVAAWFLDPAWRQVDYYGRRLDKRGARIDRAWHQSRSDDPGARLGFEKLPARAIYADGGTGYGLSRAAMRALIAQRATPEGQALEAAAFSEDKLVGALLARAGIDPGDEDFHSAVFRRDPAGGLAVPRWVSGFAPNRLGVTKVVHLDAPDTDTGPVVPQGDLSPKRIWPTHAAPRLGFNSGALHLLSAQARLNAAAGADVAVIAAIRNERDMLPHFLTHYRGLGVTGFLIADNCSDDGSTEYLSDQPDVALFSTDTEFRAAREGSDWKLALLGHYRRDRWALVADADELLLTPGGAALPGWLASLGADIDAVAMRMLDMYPGGALAEARLADAPDPFAVAGFVERRPFLATSLARGPWSDSATWTSALRHRLMPGARPEMFVAQKLALVKYRPWMRFSDSLHYATGVTRARRELLLAHFKYHAGFAARARVESARRQHFNDAEEYRRYLSLVASGREVIFDADLSIPWQDCAEVRALREA